MTPADEGPEPAPEKRDFTVEGPHIADVDAARAHQAQLAAREKAIGLEHRHRGEQAVLALIRLDREGRWSDLLKDREESGGIRSWAQAMTARYGPVVWVRGHGLPWITALYVVRYGESEHFWPAHLGPDDLARAGRWFSGATPLFVSHFPPEA